MDRDQATKLMHQLLRRVVELRGSDLFITAGFAPAIKIDGQLCAQSEPALTPEDASVLVRAVMNDRQAMEFDATKECNFAIAPPGIGRFRVSAFVQQTCSASVLRLVNATMPTLEGLQLPDSLADLALLKRGLVLIVGATGAGKSTTLAAMVALRSNNTRGHIVTIEDPVEFVHPHGRSIITQRDVGVDTQSWHAALRNALRQAPDVILIGEIRDRETMEYAIQFAETGHLVLSTLHANSANQALDRMINLVPQERREQLLMDLSLNLRGLVAQRLVTREDVPGRIAALEILLHSPLMQDLVFKGEIDRLKELMARSNRLGMKTFDQSLFELYEAQHLCYEEALRNADSKNELRLRIKLESRRNQDSTHSMQNLTLLAEEPDHA